MNPAAPRAARDGKSQPRRRARPRRPLSRGGSFFNRILALIGACWLVVGSLLAPAVPGGLASVLVAVLLLTLAPLSAFMYGRSRQKYPGALFRIIVFRPFWYAQLLLLLCGLAALPGVLVGAMFGDAAAGGRAVIYAVAIACVAVAVAGFIGSRRLIVKEMTATFPDLPAGLEGLRITQISDLHIGPQTSRRFLVRVMRAVGEAETDIIVVTGDLVDDHARDVEHYVSALGSLSARLGVYVIPGNHDVYAGWPGIRDGLRRLPLTVLVNDARVVERAGALLAVVGLGDPAGRWIPASGAAPDVSAAMRKIPPRVFVLALAHNPALWPELRERGVGLTLSGHTHWGQFAVPWLGWCLASIFVQPAMGVVARDGSLLYIHPGTGSWGIPIRIGAWPEVAVITLQRGLEVGMSSGINGSGAIGRQEHTRALTDTNQRPN